MLTVGLKVLKNKLSEYVRKVAAGETVLVTDRGKVVAELRPPREGVNGDDVRARLIREGVLTPPEGPPYVPDPNLPGIMTLEEILQDLDESRADRDLPR